MLPTDSDPTVNLVEGKQNDNIHLEKIVAERGINDYVTYIAKVLIDDPDVTVDIPQANEHWDIYKENIIPDVFDKYYHNARLTINDISPYKLRLAFGSAHIPSPIVNEQIQGDVQDWNEYFPPPTLDHKALEFCLANFDALKLKMPKLAAILEPLQDVTKLQALEKILGQSTPVNGEDYLTYLELGGEISSFDDVFQIYKNLGLSAIRSAKTILGRDISSPEDFDQLWPAQFREQVSQLPLVERMTLLALINRYALAPTMQLDPLPENVFHHNNLPEDENYFDNLSAFLQEHPDLIGTELLAFTTGMSQEEISPLLIDSIRTSFMSDEQCREYLMSRNPSEYADVAIMLTDKGTVLCPKTERRMVTEMGEGRAYVLRYVYPDSTTAVIATKFEEVTLGVCLQTTSPHFELGGIYLPDEQTHKILVAEGEKMKRDFAIHRHAVNRQSKTIAHKWAFTRSTNSEEAILYGQNLLKETYSEK